MASASHAYAFCGRWSMHRSNLPRTRSDTLSGVVPHRRQHSEDAHVGALLGGSGSALAVLCFAPSIVVSFHASPSTSLSLMRCSPGPARCGGLLRLLASCALQAAVWHAEARRIREGIPESGRLNSRVVKLQEQAHDARDWAELGHAWGQIRLLS